MHTDIKQIEMNIKNHITELTMRLETDSQVLECLKKQLLPAVNNQHSQFRNFLCNEDKTAEVYTLVFTFDVLSPFHPTGKEQGKVVVAYPHIENKNLVVTRADLTNAAKAICPELAKLVPKYVSEDNLWSAAVEKCFLDGKPDDLNSNILREGMLLFRKQGFIN